MNSDSTLERLFVEVLARTDGLESALNDALRTARTAAQEMQQALQQSTSEAGSQVQSNLGGAFNVVRESSGQFTRELSAQMRGAIQSTEQTYQEIGKLTAEMRENHEAVRAGSITREEYRRVLQSQREEIRDLRAATDHASRSLKDFDSTTRGSGKETNELSERIKSLSEQVRTQRNLWAARISDDEQFRQSTEALHKEMRELYEAGGMTGDQMRKLSGDLAYAQRGLDSVNNVASRGGLAWTAQIGIADAFGNSLRNLGPAGNMAAQGLRSAQMGFAAFNHPLDLANVNIKGFLLNAGRLTAMLPLLAAAAGAAAAGGLWRLATSHAELANSIDLATYRTGLSIESYQELRFAAQQTGVDVSILDTTMQRLQRRAADAQAGNQNLRKSFNQLGVSLTDADGNLRGTEDLLGQVADGLSAVENNPARLGLAFAVLDTAHGRLLPRLSQGSEGIAELRQEARELGLVISGDTIMSLVEFSNEVNQLKGQFHTTGVEITAAFLPVLRDVLVPLIRDTVVPWIQNVATAVGEFSDAFLDNTEAGVEFRADVVKSIGLLLQVGDVVIGVSDGVIAMSRFVGGAIAATGAWLGTLIAQLESIGPVMDELIEAGKQPFMSVQWVTGYANALTKLSNTDLSALSMREMNAAAADASNELYEAANRSSQAAANAFARALDPAQYATKFEEAFQNIDLTGLTEGVDRALREPLTNFSDNLGASGTAQAQSLSDVVQKMQRDIATAATREAHNIAAGMDEATAEAIRLGEELTVVTNAYNTLLTGDFDASDSLLMQLRQQAEDLQTALDNLPGAATATAWAGRLQLELELGVKEPQEVIDILTPRLQELIAARDELLAGGSYNTQAFKDLTADIDVLTKTVDAATNMLPEAAESAARRIVRAFTN